MKFRPLLLIYICSGLAISQAWCASTGSGLTPGVSMPDAFLGQEPSPPASGQDAVHLQPRVALLDKLLGEEHDALEKRSNELQKQSGMNDTSAGGEPGAGAPDQASIAQAMAMATQMRQGGGMQGMMMYMQYMSSERNHQRMERWADRMRRARSALDAAGAWLNKAQQQVKLRECPYQQTGEGRMQDPACIKTATLEYHNKLRALATPYLGKVASAIADVLAATKDRVDADEKMAAKLNAMKGGALLQGQVVALHNISIDTIQHYNELVRAAVDTAADAVAAASQTP
jgi:hypothetical protein